MMERGVKCTWLLLPAPAHRSFTVTESPALLKKKRMVSKNEMYL